MNIYSFVIHAVDYIITYHYPLISQYMHILAYDKGISLTTYHSPSYHIFPKESAHILPHYPLQSITHQEKHACNDWKERESAAEQTDKQTNRDAPKGTIAQEPYLQIGKKIYIVRKTETFWF